MDDCKQVLYSVHKKIFMQKQSLENFSSQNDWLSQKVYLYKGLIWISSDKSEYHRLVEIILWVQLSVYEKVTTNRRFIMN